MIKLRTMRTALNNLDLNKYKYFLEYDQNKLAFLLVCIYDDNCTQIQHSVRFKDYSSYTPQFLEITEKMDDLVKVLNKNAE